VDGCCHYRQDREKYLNHPLLQEATTVAKSYFIPG